MLKSGGIRGNPCLISDFSGNLSNYISASIDMIM